MFINLILLLRGLFQKSTRMIHLPVDTDEISKAKLDIYVFVSACQRNFARDDHVPIISFKKCNFFACG